MKSIIHSHQPATRIATVEKKRRKKCTRLRNNWRKGCYRLPSLSFGIIAIKLISLSRLRKIVSYDMREKYTSVSMCANQHPSTKMEIHPVVDLSFPLHVISFLISFSSEVFFCVCEDDDHHTGELESEDVPRMISKNEHISIYKKWNSVLWRKNINFKDTRNFSRVS